MTNKSIIILLLAIVLVAVFAATGAFADVPVFTDFQPLGTDFATVVQGQVFAKLSRSDLNGYSASNPCYLFNGLSAYYSGSLYFVFDGSTSSWINFSGDIYFYINGNNLAYTTGSYTFGALGPSSGSIIFVGSYSPLKYSDMSITLGSTFTGVPSSAAYSYSMTVPAGYALRIYSSDNYTLQTISLSVPNSWNFPSLSGSSSRYNGSRFGLYDDSNLVDGGSADIGSFVPWTALNSNLFGKASAYSYSFSPDYPMSDGYSYIITNPLYAGEAVQNESAGFHQNTDMIATIQYNTAGSVSFSLIPLVQSLESSNGTFYYSNTFDIDLGVFPGTSSTPSEGETGTVDFGNPPIGGGNADQPPLSDNTTIFGILSTLTSTVTNLFNKAAEAMQSLVQSCNSFFVALVGLFGWLPPEWSAVLWSFFIILTVLGVVKLFL